MLNEINENSELEVVCCFCGESLLIESALILNLQIGFESDASQQLFCHKKHFIDKIHKSIFLDPDLFEED